MLACHWKCQCQLQSQTCMNGFYSCLHNTRGDAVVVGGTARFCGNADCQDEVAHFKINSLTRFKQLSVALDSWEVCAKVLEDAEIRRPAFKHTIYCLPIMPVHDLSVERESCVCATSVINA